MKTRYCFGLGRETIPPGTRKRFRSNPEVPIRPLYVQRAGPNLKVTVFRVAGKDQLKYLYSGSPTLESIGAETAQYTRFDPCETTQIVEIEVENTLKKEVTLILAVICVAATEI